MIKTNLYFAKNNQADKKIEVIECESIIKSLSVAVRIPKKNEKRVIFLISEKNGSEFFRFFFSLNGQKFKNDIEFSSQLY